MKPEILKDGQKLKNGKNIIQMPDGRIKVVTVNTEPSKTQQQFKDDVDINKIMAKHRKTGMITHLNYREGVYGDFSEVKDYQQSLETVMKAEDSFASLPSQIRNKFENNPQKLIEFLNDPKNNEEAINLKLKVRPKLDPSDKIVNAINKMQKTNDEPNDDKKSAKK